MLLNPLDRLKDRQIFIPARCLLWFESSRQQLGEELQLTVYNLVYSFLPRLPLCSHLHDEAGEEEMCRRCRGEMKSAGRRAGTFASTLVFHSLRLISQYSVAVDGGLFIDLLDD